MNLDQAMEDDERVDEFFLIKDVCDKTRQTYTNHIKYYCESTGTKNKPPLTPEQLIREALDEWYDHKHVSDQQLKKRLLRFKKYLSQKDSLSINTKRRVLLNIKAFYTAFEIEWPKTVKIDAEPIRELTIDELPSIKQIKYAFENTPDLKYKTALLILTSSGLSGIDVRNLTYGDFLKAIESYYQPTKSNILNIDLLAENLEGKEVIPVWEGHRLKPPHIYYMTFNSPEASRYLVKYLHKNPPESLDTPLLHYKGNVIKAVTWHAYFARINRHCEFPKITNEGLMCPHNLRRRFETWCIEQGVDFVQAERMMGHVLPRTNRSYIKLLSVEAMKKAYLKALPALTVIDEVEVKVLTDERLLELEERDRQREAERKKEKEEKNKAMEELQDHIENLYKLMGDKEFKEKHG